MPHHSGSEHVKLVLGAYNCCIFKLFTWTYAIKALLLFSSFVGSLYFRRIIYSIIFRGHDNQSDNAFLGGGGGIALRRGG